jgi:segregation and condensation protein B
MTLSPTDAPVAEDQLKPALAGMLFVAAEPIPISVLARTTGWPPGKVRTCLEELAADLEGRGLNLQITDKAVQLATDPAVAEVIRRFLGKADDGRLSRGALETLSIVAFKQPVQRTTIETMRGVNSDYMIGRLKERDLIVEVGRANGPGRPCLYGTTFRFLEHFGLSSLSDLELSTLARANGNYADEPPEATGVPALATSEAALGV